MRERLSRPVTPIRNAALAGFVTAAVLTCGPATGPAAMANAAPSDPGDQTTAEQRIIDGHVVKQRGCTLRPSHPTLRASSGIPRASHPTPGARERSRMPIRDWAANFAPTG